MTPKRVTVFCSSSDKVSPIYFSEMENLGRLLAKNNIEIMYGGACVGLMGCLAKEALKHGGKVFGVIPEYLNKKGIVHESLTQLDVVDNLLDRKRKMLQGSDAVIAFPGGIGTIDEVTEIMALKQLNEYENPIYFIDFLDTWKNLFECFAELKERSMISQDLNDIYTNFNTSEDMIKSWGI